MVLVKADYHKLVHVSCMPCKYGLTSDLTSYSLVYGSMWSHRFDLLHPPVIILVVSVLLGFLL